MKQNIDLKMLHNAHFNRTAIGQTTLMFDSIYNTILLSREKGEESLIVVVTTTEKAGRRLAGELIHFLNEKNLTGVSGEKPQIIRFISLGAVRRGGLKGRDDYYLFIDNSVVQSDVYKCL